jgi:tetratricopeptide (TPR) repeat protein
VRIVDVKIESQAVSKLVQGRISQDQSVVADHDGNQLALHNSRKEEAALLQAPVAIWEALFGQYSAARRDAAANLRLSVDREVKYAGALAFALSQDPESAQALATDLERTYPMDTSVQFNYLPSLRAVIALDRHAPSEAIQCLQATSAFESGSPRSSIQGLFGAMYPVYLRGKAYLALNQGRQAAAQFQKVIDHPGVTLTDPIGALSLLELARADSMAGDHAGAEAAYSRFRKLWAGADHTLPVMKLAQTFSTTSAGVGI